MEGRGARLYSCKRAYPSRCPPLSPTPPSSPPLRFDIEFSLTEGTTYNAYLIFGEDKTALVDASHEKFRGLFMDALAQELSSRGRTLDYLLVSHTEPDHSGLAGDVLERYPGCTALGSKVCLQVRGGDGGGGVEEGNAGMGWRYGRECLARPMHGGLSWHLCA